MSNLTRYTMVVRRDHEGFATAAGKVRQNGEWVKFDDIKELLNTAHNNARDEILLCADERTGCSSHVSVCTLHSGGCTMQRKTSPVCGTVVSNTPES